MPVALILAYTTGLTIFAKVAAQADIEPCLYLPCPVWAEDCCQCFNGGEWPCQVCTWDFGCWINPFEPDGQWWSGQGEKFECIWNPSCGPRLEDCCPYVKFKSCNTAGGREVGPCCDDYGKPGNCRDL